MSLFLPGMIHVGEGAKHVRQFMATLNMPSPCQKTMKKKEREVGQALEQLAAETCREATEQEKMAVSRKRKHDDLEGEGDEPTGPQSPAQNKNGLELVCFICDKSVPSTLRTCAQCSRKFHHMCGADEHGKLCNVCLQGGPAPGPDKSASTTVGLAVSYDMGWAKRGKGHNSLEGVGHAIGVETGKVLSFGTRKKRCATCWRSEQRGVSPPKHDCRRNWYGSAKAMEGDVAVQLASQARETTLDVSYSTFIGDDDACTISKLHKEVSADIEKWSDVVHAKRSLGKHLFELRDNTKERELTQTNIAHLQTCFSYAVRQNKDDATTLAAALKNIPAHLFGDHSQCDSLGKWCRASKEGELYEHRGTTGGKDLSSKFLRSKVDAIFDVFAENSAKLCHAVDSQKSESFNAMVTSKAPKTRHYGSSESYDYRVSAAVCQKNHGHNYVSEVLQRLELSPGNECKKQMQAEDNELARKMKQRKEKKWKKRRRELKTLRSSAQKAHEVREGTTYQTGAGYLPIDDSDTEEVPAAKTAPSYELLTPGTVPQAFQLIFFDVETTSLQFHTEIVQLSACCKAASFNRYVVPSGPISNGATRVTGLSKEKFCGKDILCKNGKPVETTDLDAALTDFVDWLKPFSTSGPVLLCAHNAENFDIRVFLLGAMSAGCVDDVSSVVTGFVDTLPLFRKAMPQLKSHSLSIIYQATLGTTFAAHDAVEDVQALERVMTAKGLEQQAISGGVSFTSAVSLIKHRAHVHHNVGTLEAKLAGTLSMGMITKIAGSGLSYRHLLLAHKRSGAEGISSLLTEKVGGKPRVTRTKRVLNAVTAHFENI